MTEKFTPGRYRRAFNRSRNGKTVRGLSHCRIENEKGVVILNGGDVPSVNVTFDGNGGTTGGNNQYVQRIDWEAYRCNNYNNLPITKRFHGNNYSCLP